MSCLWRTCAEPEDLRFKGRHVLQVARAPLPSEVLWENLAKPWSIKFWHTRFTGLMLGAVMSLSIALICVHAAVVHPDSAVESPLGTESNSSIATADSTYEDGLVPWNGVEVAPSMYGFSFSVALCVALSNAALPEVLRRMVDQESRNLVSDKEASVLQRLAIRYIFTSSILLVGLSLPRAASEAVGIGFLWPSNGYTDLNRDWYRRIGLTLQWTFILDVIGAWIIPMSRIIARNAMILLHRWHLQTIYSQRALDLLYIGSECNLAERHAQILHLFFVAAVFGGPMPMLTLLAALSLSVWYWVDKFMILRACKIPTFAGAVLPKQVAKCFIPIAILRIVFSTWSFAASSLASTRILGEFAIAGIFVSHPNESQAGLHTVSKVLSESHMLPLTACIAIVMISIIVQVFRSMYLVLESYFCP